MNIKLNTQSRVFSAMRNPASSAPAESNAASNAAGPSDSAQISAQSSGVNVAALLAETADEAASLAKKLPEHVQGEVIVKLKPDFARATPDTVGTLGGFAEEYGGKVLQKFDIPDNMYKSFNGEMVRMKLPAGMSAAEAIAAMGKDNRVEYAVTNDIIKAGPVEETTSNETAGKPDNLNTKLWGLHNEGQTGGTADADVDAPEAWGIQTGNGGANGPLIAVIDTGINYNHEALKANVWTNPGEIAGNGIDDDNNGVVDDVHGFNAAADNGDPLDDNDHGSHCMGSIAGSGEGSKGLFGVMHNAQVMGVKFLTGNGGGTLADAIESVLYSTKMGARITSNSWGGGGFNQALYDAFKASPAMHIIAAGNESNNNDSRPAYPATFDLPNVISVAATDHNDNIARFSNYGATTVDLAAPGVDVYSATSGSSTEYKSFSGTSMATPHVTGVAGLVVSQFPEISNEELKARLMNTVDRKSQLAGKMVTGGRVNAFNALEIDEVAPGTPGDLAVASAKAGKVELSFTATGDDGNVGQASAYVLKVSDKPIVDGEAGEGQVSFNDAPSVPVGAPGAAGTTENLAVKTRLSGSEQKLYFALKVQDNIGNLSGMTATQATVPPASVAFEDNVDGAAQNFFPEGTWAKVDAEGRGKVWTDSPEGSYDKDANSSLMSRQISLANLENSTLVFDAKTDLESGYDFVHVEVAEATGNREQPNWVEVAKLNGASDWGTNEVDISAFDGKEVNVRFRLKSDSSVNQDGIYLDNFVIAGASK